MAYMNAQTVKEIRTAIRGEFPTSKGWKFSVTRHHYSGVNVDILQGPVEFPKDYDQVNQYYFKDHYTAEQSAVLDRILKIIALVAGGNYDRNAGDVTADYADFNYFIHLTVGRWDHKYQLV